MEQTMYRPAVKFPLVVVFIVVLVIASTMYIVTNVHALERHGSSVVAAATNCFSNNPTMLRMYNPSTGRNADVCFDGEKFHVHITQKGSPITTFTKDKMKSIEQVARYLINAGYEFIH